MVFEPLDAAGAGVAGGGVDGVVFCVVILCLSALSMIIFAASSGHGHGDDDEGMSKRPRGSSAGRAAPNGPVFVGGRGCACGSCRAGTGAGGICGTYLS